MTAEPEVSDAYAADARMAFTLFNNGQLEAAAKLCERLIAGGPPFRDISHLMGVLQIQRSNFEDARKHLEEADRLEPGNEDVVFQLALTYDQLDDPVRASAAWARVLEFKPDNAMIWIKHAYGLRDLGQLDEAEACIDKALSLDPENPKILHEKGYHLHKLARQFSQAEAYYRAAMEADPSYLDAHVNFALLARSSGDWPTLKARIEEVHQKFPDDTGWYLGMEQLRHGAFKEGWKNYEKRYQRPGAERVDLQFDMPVWQGEDLSEKSLLFWTDQGVGDELMGLHLAAPLLQTARQVCIVCTEAVQSIVERCFPSCACITHETIQANGQVPTADYHASFSDVTLQTITSWQEAESVPKTFTPNPDLVAHFRQKYRADDGPLIGIAWKSPKSLIAPDKATQLNNWDPLFDLPDLRFVNVQYGVDGSERTYLEDRLGSRIIFDDELIDGTNMDLWMAQAAALDLSVTVSTTTTHLLGVCHLPSWILLSAGDGLSWHWFLDRTDSPWYPGARLYRQDVPDQWGPVFDRVVRDLTAKFSLSNQGA